jgi:predicted restriction endonuclease
MAAVPKSIDGLSRHDERAKKAFARDAVWRAVLRKVALRDGNKCRVCGKRCRFGAHQIRYYADPHHVTPRSLGGGDTLDNIAMLCRPCHDERHVHGRLAIEGDANTRDADGRFCGLRVSRFINGQWHEIGRR